LDYIKQTPKKAKDLPSYNYFEFSLIVNSYTSLVDSAWSGLRRQAAGHQVKVCSPTTAVFAHEQTPDKRMKIRRK
jgi:hypothetical protein